MIIRVHKQERYTTIDNAFLCDQSLSWKAKGLFAYMLSRPNDWRFNEKHLSTVSKDKKSAVSKAIHELQDAGYLNRHAKRDENNGRITGYEYDLYENKQMAKQGIKQAIECELPITRFSDDGKPDDGKSAPTKYLKIQNTDNTNIKEIIAEYYKLLTENKVDTSYINYSVLTKSIKSWINGIDYKKIIECMPNYFKDKWAIENKYPLSAMIKNMHKYAPIKTTHTRPLTPEEVEQKMKESIK